MQTSTISEQQTTQHAHGHDDAHHHTETFISKYINIGIKYKYKYYQH